MVCCLRRGMRQRLISRRPSTAASASEEPGNLSVSPGRAIAPDRASLQDDSARQAVRFADLLDEDPGVEPGLRALAEEVAPSVRPETGTMQVRRLVQAISGTQLAPARH